MEPNAIAYSSMAGLQFAFLKFGIWGSWFEVLSLELVFLDLWFRV